MCVVPNNIHHQVHDCVLGCMPSILTTNVSPRTLVAEQSVSSSLRVSMPAPPPNFVRRRPCRTDSLAKARTCIRHLAGNLLAPVRQILYSSSCWSAEVRPSHVNQCHNLSSTLTRGDLRQHHFQRLQCKRVQLWPRVRLAFLRDPPRAHTGLPLLSLVTLHPSRLDGCFPRLTQGRLSRPSRVHLVTNNALHFVTSEFGTQLNVKPSTSGVIPMPPLPQAE